jgi:hypothetical protein
LIGIFGSDGGLVTFYVHFDVRTLRLTKFALDPSRLIGNEHN